MRFRIEVGECETIPKGFGAAYRVEWAMKWVCYPLPFNRLAGWIKSAQWWVYRRLVAPGRNNLRERELISAYDAGFNAGLKRESDGYIRGLIKAIRDSRGDGA